MGNWDGLLQITNETLTAIIAIVAASVLLYNLSRNLRSRVARASSVLLACVTIVSMIDVIISLEPSTLSLRSWLRVQWVGIAFAPAAMFHLSDALLATTGLVSRGRRRRVVRRLYYLSTLFFILAFFTDALIYGLVFEPASHMLPGPVFWLFVVYYVIATIVSVYNVLRARQRCRTTYTYRRMGYLLYSFTLPALGIFPYSLLFGDSSSASLFFWILVNLSNLVIILMLFFMSYPLSLFGSNIPDRVVKTELLAFSLRGPVAGILVLLVIVYLPQAGRVLGLPGEELMLFVAVVVVMFWQWMVSLTLPYLERHLVYPDDQDQIGMVQTVGQRLLTQNDFRQIFEALLAAVCDLVQVPIAFLVAVDGEQVHIEEVVGGWQPDTQWQNSDLLQTLRHLRNGQPSIFYYQDFWVVPLYSGRILEPSTEGEVIHRLLGAIGVQARSVEINLSEEEQRIFEVLVHQAGQALDDQVLQKEVFAALEGLLPEMESIQKLRNTARYGTYPLTLTDDSAAALEPEYIKAVRNALRDYWGGPRLTKSPLLQLEIVQSGLDEHENNPTRALRTVLYDAVNQLRPEGQRSTTQAEWTLYNIVELRFIQGYKVRDVAKRLSMSEADLYRKQRAAIEEVARAIAKMEQESQSQDKETGEKQQQKATFART
ncbi:histidine kinase N-terminal 7TM domain-containing protein [Chloroflexota bacterium]